MPDGVQLFLWVPIVVRRLSELGHSNRVRAAQQQHVQLTGQSVIATRPIAISRAGCGARAADVPSMSSSVQPVLPQKSPQHPLHRHRAAAPSTIRSSIPLETRERPRPHGYKLDRRKLKGRDESLTRRRPCCQRRWSETSRRGSSVSGTRSHVFVDNCGLHEHDEGLAAHHGVHKLAAGPATFGT